jgi:hypothetical protein
VKKIASAIRAHWAQHGGWRLLLGLTLLLGTGLLWRYFFKQDPYFRDREQPWAWGIVFYALPYFGACAVYAWQSRNWQFFRQKGFWKVSAALLFVPFANQFLLFYRQGLAEWVAPETLRFWWKVVFNMHTSFFYLLIPMLWYVREKAALDSFYGLTAKNFDPKPYLLMLGLMLPLLVWASFQPDFLSTYPRYRPETAEAYWGVPAWLTVGGYELSYALQFLALEVFFRGFMNEKLRPYLGEGAVFVMASVYCYIHFGKPMAESVSSIFGGYILGVVAMRTRSVMGGVMVHVGIALGMEWLAYLQPKS